MKTETQLVVELLRLGTFLTRTGNRLMAGHGLSQQQFVILKTIEERGPISQLQIRNQLLYERSNVSKATSYLVSLGFVETTKSTEDKRVTFLAITSEGKQTITACMNIFNKWNKSWSNQLGAKERRQLVRLLRKVK
ncbi:MAG: winged helix-turn-helix transcriptional regulator [Deltaproteobacteria bacterium]|nr:winged helix-turn-helix transcriptional regulator [Deltaproteobacteria bacterium]